MNHCVYLAHPSAGLLTDDAAAAETDDLVVDRSYVKKKLEHGLTRIWQVRVACAHMGTLPDPPCSISASLPFSLQDVQLKVKAYILGTDMSNFKYDDFIVVLDVISRYTAGGRAHPSHL